MKKTWFAVAVAAACAALAFGCGKGKAPGAEEAEAPAAVQLTPEQEAKAAVDSFIGALQAGRMDEIYKLLPASYQADVSGVVKAYTAKIDPALFEQASGVLATLADVMDAQAANLATLLAEQDGEMELAFLDSVDVKAEDIRAGAKWLGSAVRSLTYDNCAAGNVMPLLEMAPARVLIDTAMEQSGFGTLSCALAEPDGEPQPEGIVKMNLSYQEPGADATDTETVDLVKVDGKWVPLELSQSWGEMIQSALQGADEFSVDEETAAMLNQLLPMVRNALESLKTAKSAKELQAQAMGSFMGIAMMMGN